MKHHLIFPASLVSLISLLLALMIANDALAAKKAKAKHKSKPVTSTVSNVKYVLNIPYASAVVALAALEQRSDVIANNNPPHGWETHENWKIFKERPADRPGVIEWAFTEPEHAAHPSVIKRYFDVGSSDHIYIDTAIKCSSNTSACMDLSEIVGKANWRIKKNNERYFVKEGEFLWKDSPDARPIKKLD